MSAMNPETAVGDLRLIMGEARPASAPCEHCYCIPISAFTPVGYHTLKQPHVKCCNCGHQRVENQ